MSVKVPTLEQSAVAMKLLVEICEKVGIKDPATAIALFLISSDGVMVLSNAPTEKHLRDTVIHILMQGPEEVHDFRVKNNWVN